MSAGQSVISARGAGIRGDDYQHLFAWIQAARAFPEDSEILEIGIEDPRAKGVDDVTVQLRGGGGEFSQCKSSVTARELVSLDWLLEFSKAGGQSMLQKFFEFWTKASGSMTVALRLVTNRPIDPTDPVLSWRDGRDGTLRHVPKGTPRSILGKASSRIMKHLGCTSSQLISFLEVLRIDLGKIDAELRSEAALVMGRVGLRCDHQAVNDGMALVRGWVTGGKRKLSSDEIRREVRAAGLVSHSRVATLLVQALQEDPFPSSATASVNWVGLFRGSEARNRRQLRNPSDWNTRLRPDLRAAVKRIRAKGLTHVRVEGNMRLPTAFTVGVELGETAGFSVESVQKEETWSSRGASATVDLQSSEVSIGRGSRDLAICVAVATDPTADVVAFLKSRGAPPVAACVTVAPKTGAGEAAVRDGAHARGLATSIRDRVRDLARRHKAKRVHLFLVIPKGLALLLGHKWDRMPDTQLYDDLGQSRGYSPGFRIPN